MPPAAPRQNFRVFAMVCGPVIEMGGVACEIESDNQQLAQLVAQRYRGFLSQAALKFSIRVEVLSSPEGDRDPFEIDQGPVEIRYHDHDLHLSGKTFSAHCDLKARTGRIRQGLNLTPLDLLLKVLYSQLLLQEDAFFLHACALVRNEKGYLFFGPTGSGKSTLARLAGRGILADEFVIVKRQPHAVDQPYAVYGTPFWGGMNAAAPLVGLFHLRHAKRHTEVLPLTPVSLLRKLFPCLGGFIPAVHEQACLFDLAGSLVKQVLGYEFHFVPDATVWSHVDATAR